MHRMEEKSFLNIINELNRFIARRKFLNESNEIIFNLINDIYFLIGEDTKITTDNIEKSEILLDILVKSAASAENAISTENDMARKRIVYDIFKKYFSQYLYLSSADDVSSLVNIGNIIKRNMIEIKTKRSTTVHFMEDFSETTDDENKRDLHPLTINLFASVLDKLEKLKEDYQMQTNEKRSNLLLLNLLIADLDIEFKKLSHNDDANDKLALLQSLVNAFNSAKDSSMSNHLFNFLSKSEVISLKKAIYVIVKDCFSYYCQEEKTSMQEMAEGISDELRLEMQKTNMPPIAGPSISLYE